MRPDAHAEIQIARGAAIRSGFPFTGSPHAGAVFNSDGNPHIDTARVSTLLDRDAAGRPVVRLFKRELHLVLDVATFLRSRCASLACTAARLARPAAAEE